MTLVQLVDRHYAEIESDDFSDAAEIFSPDVVRRRPANCRRPAGPWTCRSLTPFGVVHGKITEHRIYYDTVGMLAQLGLAPEPASA